MYRLHQYSSFSPTLLYAPSGTCVCINPIGGDGPRQPLSRGPRNRVTPWRHNGGNYPRDTHRTYVYTLPYVALVGQIIANEKLSQRHKMTFVQGLQGNAHEQLVVLCKKTEFGQNITSPGIWIRRLIMFYSSESKGVIIWLIRCKNIKRSEQIPFVLNLEHVT